MLRFRNSQSAARRRYQWGKQTRKTPAKKTKSTAGKSTSIFNASVPLAQTRHTGVVNPGAKGGTPHIEGGVHHYPTPITDIQLFKRDDFQLGFSTIRNNRRLWCPRGSAGRGKAMSGSHTPLRALNFTRSSSPRTAKESTCMSMRVTRWRNRRLPPRTLRMQLKPKRQEGRDSYLPQLRRGVGVFDSRASCKTAWRTRSVVSM